MLSAFVLLIASGLLFLLFYTKRTYTYWQRHGVPYVQPLPGVGNLWDLLATKVSFGELFQQLYEHKSLTNSPLGGIYVLHQPALILRDPELIKLVMIKHFDKFLNRFEAADGVHDAMGSLSLPLSKYHIWRECRIKFATAFTSGKMKERMYPLMLQISQELENYLDRKIEGNSEAILEVKEMCSLYTTDLTSLLHYGQNAESLKHGYSDLRRQALELFDVNFMKILHFFIVFFLPHLTGILRAKVFSKSYMDFMRKFTKLIYSQRFEKTPKSQKGDLMDILLRFKLEHLNTQHFTQHRDFIPSQVAIFLLAGFETSSSILGFILYELAKQPELQKRLKRELNRAFNGRPNLSYEEFQSQSYLHQVVSEGLRLYPAASFINRECTAPDSNGGFQLTPSVFVPNGMPVYVSILGLQRDARFWPEPDKFIPARFSAEAVKNINPMTYIPFGTGPHGCIGSRLGFLQVKMGLAHILKRYRVEICCRTVNEIKFDPMSFMLQAKDGIYLKFIKD